MDLNTAAVIFMGGYVLVIVVAGLILSLRPGGGTVPLNLSGPSGPGGGGGRSILLGGDLEAMGNFRGRVESVLVASRGGRLEAITLASAGGMVEGARHLATHAGSSVDAMPSGRPTRMLGPPHERPSVSEGGASHEHDGQP